MRVRDRVRGSEVCVCVRERVRALQLSPTTVRQGGRLTTSCCILRQ